MFNRTLFTRDDQVFQQLNAGINAGQHEGGGKSLEIRRFGFNLDHGGVNGGLKVLVDDVQQNQGTQGHGQGYLGSLKALSPELISEVIVINGPFNAEYGDFSGLGVVHIRQRESLRDELTARLQAGNFDTGRTFLAWSPSATSVDSYLAYEGAYTNGPFEAPLRYRRDNVNANYTKTLSDTEKLGFRLLFGRNDFYSSGQVPLDLVSAGVLNRFGYLDPTDGGRVRLGTVSSYYSKISRNGDTLRADGFLGRSLFDLYSNFTFFLHDPIHGDAFQQHDSRLGEGANVQYVHFSRWGSTPSSFTAGANLHDNQINVGLYPQEGRVPKGVTTRAHAHVTNEAAYAQESVSFFRNRLLLGAGIRFDEFRYNLQDRIDPASSGIQSADKWQGKGNVAFTPSHRVPVTFYENYGRGINSVDARAVVQRPEQPRLATTDFYQAGISSNWTRFSVSADTFLIDHSHEQVYIPDDGSFEFKGPSLRL
ncbi:MAG: TonB-dependent receptor plug domain-containing protein [Bryobacteraceae bacterium]